MGKRCSCTTSHEASRKIIHQPWLLFFLPEIKEMTTEVQRWAHVGGHRKDALAWSFPGEIGTNVCSSQIGSWWQVTLTSSSKSSLGKQWIYWAPLKSTGEGLLPGASCCIITRSHPIVDDDFTETARWSSLSSISYVVQHLPKSLAIGGWGRWE